MHGTGSGAQLIFASCWDTALETPLTRLILKENKEQNVPKNDQFFCKSKWDWNNSTLCTCSAISVFCLRVKWQATIMQMLKDQACDKSYTLWTRSGSGAQTAILLSKPEYLKRRLKRYLTRCIQVLNTPLDLHNCTIHIGDPKATN